MISWPNDRVINLFIKVSILLSLTLHVLTFKIFLNFFFLIIVKMATRIIWSDSATDLLVSERRRRNNEYLTCDFDKCIQNITSVKIHYVCQNALRLLKCITSVKMHYVCQNALRLSKCITSVKMHYGYVNSDSAQLP